MLLPHVDSGADSDLQEERDSLRTHSEEREGGGLSAKRPGIQRPRNTMPCEPLRACCGAVLNAGDRTGLPTELDTVLSQN